MTNKYNIRKNVKKIALTGLSLAVLSTGMVGCATNPQYYSVEDRCDCPAKYSTEKKPFFSAPPKGYKIFDDSYHSGGGHGHHGGRGRGGSKGGRGGGSGGR